MGMALGAPLGELHEGDRVRVLGWLDEAAFTLDAVARVSSVTRHDPADDSPVDRRTVTVSLEPVGGVTAGFDEVLPAGIETAGQLALHDTGAPGEDGTEVVIWRCDPETGSFEPVGHLQHLAVVAG